MPGGARLCTRMPEGKVPVTLLGVAGRTLTEVCGERAAREVLERFGDAMEFGSLDVLLARVWPAWCGCMLRMEETEEDVDLRPDKCADLRR